MKNLVIFYGFDSIRRRVGVGELVRRQVDWYSKRLQKRSKCSKNITDTLSCASCTTFLFLRHFDIICGLLLNRCTATWNLFIRRRLPIMRSKTVYFKKTFTSSVSAIPCFIFVIFSSEWKVSAST